MYKVRLYFSTGYDLLNVPDNPGKLNNEAYLDVPYVDILQGKFLDELTVKCVYEPTGVVNQTAGSWDSLGLVDYIRVSEVVQAGNVTGITRSTYYSVLKVEMLANDTAKFYIAEDVISTAGGAEYIGLHGGIITRRSKNNNNYLDSSFLQDEYLGCAQPLELEYNVVSKGTSPISFVESTLDLASGLNYEVIGVAPDTIVVPIMQATPRQSVYRMQRTDGINNQQIPDTFLYNPSGAALYSAASFPNNIAKARSLGIENGIISQYAIPSNFFTQQTDPLNDNVNLTGRASLEDSTFDIIPSDVDTDEIYTCIFSGDKSQFRLLSAAGDEISFNAEELAFYIDDTDQKRFKNDVYIKRVVDPRPEGRPFYRFEYVNGEKQINGSREVTDLAFSVKGCQWTNIPLKFVQVSGSDIMTQEFHNSRRLTDRQYAGEKAQLANTRSLDRLKEAYEFIKYGAEEVLKTGANYYYGLDFLNGGMLKNFTKDAVESVDRLLRNRVPNMAMVNASDIAQATAEGSYQIQKFNELYTYGVQTQTIAPEIWFAGDVNTIRDITSNGCIVYRYKPTEADQKRLTAIIKMFGEKIFEPIAERSSLSNLCINRGYYFSYIQISGAEIDVAGPGIEQEQPPYSPITPTTAGLNMRERSQLAQQLSAGVRIWKNATPKTYRGDRDHLNLTAIS